MTAVRKKAYVILDGTVPPIDRIAAAAAVQAAACTARLRDSAGEACRNEERFATPVGTSKTTHLELEQGLWLTGLGAAGVGLLMLIGGLLLALRGRRRPAAA